MKGLRGTQVCRAVGISYRVLDYWARTGVLVPSISEAHGSGSQRRYSEADVRIGRVLNMLRVMGVRGEHLRAVAERLRATPPGDRVYVSPGGYVYRDEAEAARWSVWLTIDIEAGMPVEAVA